MIGVRSGVVEDVRHHEADERERLGQCEPDVHVGADHAGGFGLPGHGLHAVANTSPMLALTRYQVAIVNTATRMCPANMFPKSRIASVNGRTMMYCRISTGARISRIGPGTPDGIMLLK